MTSPTATGARSAGGLTAQPRSSAVESASASRHTGRYAGQPPGRPRCRRLRTVAGYAFRMGTRVRADDVAASDDCTSGRTSRSGSVNALRSRSADGVELWPRRRAAHAEALMGPPHACSVREADWCGHGQSTRLVPEGQLAFRPPIAINRISVQSLTMPSVHLLSALNPI